MEKIMITDINRYKLRNALHEFIPQDRNILLKDKLITITTSKTNYSVETFKKKIRLFNAMLNKKIFKRRWKKHINRIVFFTFIEKSPTNELLHCHMLIRVPDYLNANEIICTFNAVVIRFKDDYDNDEFEFDCRDRWNAIKYSTKQFSDYNDNLVIN